MGLDRSELFNPPLIGRNDDDDDGRVFPFSSILPLVVADSRLTVEGGNEVCSLGVGSSSEISEYAGEEEMGGGVFLLFFESRLVGEEEDLFSNASS